MNIEEFTEIVESYGSESASWPEEIRQECIAFMANDPAARELINRQWQLDRLLDQRTVPVFPELESRVLNQQLPDRRGPLLDRVLAWMLPSEKHFLRPVLLACLPLLFGIFIGNFFSFGVDLENDGFAYWDDELTMLSLNDYTENSF